MTKTILVILFLFFAFSLNAQNGTNALKFNGSTGYFASTLATGSSTSTFTLEFWFSPVAYQAGTVYLADVHSLAGDQRRRLIPYLSNGLISFYGQTDPALDTDVINYPSTIAASAGVWYHYAVVINGTSFKLFINGSLNNSWTTTGSYYQVNNDILSLGVDYWRNEYSKYSNVKIDEVRLWNTARSEAEIKVNMYKELAGSESGLIAYYKMSNGSGAVVTDDKSTGTDYNGTLSNGYAWIASGCFAGPRNALDFGTNDYVSLPTTFVNNEMSVEMWAYANDWTITSSYQTIIGCTEEGGWAIYLENSKVLADVGKTTGGYANVSYSAANLAGWNHIAFTADGTYLKLFINGKLVGTTPTGSTFSNPIRGVTTTIIGTEMGANNSPDIYYYGGKVDEVRIWNDVRTESEIRENMMRTLVGNEGSLSAYYRFDHFDGITLYDLTSNAFYGTLINMEPATDWAASTAFNTWIGSESSTWSVAANWSKGTTPSLPTDNIGLYKWTTLGNECAISGTPAVNNLLFASTSNPTLNSNFTVNGNLLLEKNLDINGQIITLGSNGSISEGSYRLYGSSGTITTTASLSNISAQNVGGLGAAITTSANMGSTTITRGHVAQTSNGKSSITRYYDISPTNNSGLAATLVFNYVDTELNGNTESNLRAWKSSDGGSTWSNAGGTVNTSDNTVTLNSIDGFSRWTLGDENPIAITLAFFTASYENGAVALNWITESEIGNAGFILERSENSGSWAEIASLKTDPALRVKSTTGRAEYSFSDITVKADGSYRYRLSDVSLDGQITSHPAVAVQLEKSPDYFALHAAYPNPFNPMTTIAFDLPVAGAVTLTVYDINGRQVDVLLQETLEAGRHQRAWDAVNFPSGVYFIQMQTEGFTAMQRVLLLK